MENNSKMVPMSCMGVKCMVKGCSNLSSHKVIEDNIWWSAGQDNNDERELCVRQRSAHGLGSYLCDEHFDMIMSREEKYDMPDDRFVGRFCEKIN